MSAIDILQEYETRKALIKKAKRHILRGDTCVKVITPSIEHIGKLDMMFPRLAVEDYEKAIIIITEVIKQEDKLLIKASESNELLKEIFNKLEVVSDIMLEREV